VTVQLDDLAGLVAVDRQRQQATIRAGTRLRDLGPLLAAEGLALENQGDVDAQSLGGVLATATHGTGIGLGCVASRTLALDLVLATGDTLTLERDRDGPRFLGARGVARLPGRRHPGAHAAAAAYRLHEVRRTIPLEQCLTELPRLTAEHRHFEFLWFPYTDLALTKTLDLVADAADPPGQRDRLRSWLADVAVDNAGFWLVCQAARAFPSRTPALNRFCARTSGQGSWRGPAHRIFPSPRLVRFQEMEYALPAENGPDCLREIRERLDRERLPVTFPLEYRHVAADDLWLSPFHGRDSATISVHMYRGQDHRPLFQAVEAIFQNHAGRPHWGKKHTAGPAYLRRLYPRWDTFQALRRSWIRWGDS
jgi:FAD-linked oxidoreductase